ncbi:hypothetical protein Lepto7375DRAFT_1065 [Leptolyngbya sp. PCC 7375]|nr:hypothetical protein Lepto7375DRAFT_1065 [Leptolyngbya sp. PCC 7375]
MLPLQLKKIVRVSIGVTLLLFSSIGFSSVQAQTSIIRSCSSGQRKEPFDKTVEDIILRTETLDDEIRDSFDDFGLENIEEAFDAFVERDFFTRRDANNLKRATIRLFEEYIELVDPYTDELNETFKPILEAVKFYSRGELQKAINTAEELPDLSEKLEEQLESISGIEEAIARESQNYQELFLQAVLRSPLGRQINSSQRQQLSRQIQGSQDVVRQNIRSNLLFQTRAAYAASYAMIGNIYISIGNTEKALPYLEQSLTLSQKLPNQLIQGQTLKAGNSLSRETSRS